jgi:hypothetical protein
MNILVLNVGSSSLKGRLYALAGSIPSDPVEPLWDLQADWASRDGPAGIRIRTRSGALLNREVPINRRCVRSSCRLSKRCGAGRPALSRIGTGLKR